MASILKVDKLDPQSGTALEIGTSGDTITVPSGATFAVSGTMNASSITAGTVATARLGTGTASSSTILYGDNTWAGGAVTALNNATENELVSVGSTTTELDAEANLTFDGNTLVLTGTVEPSFSATKTDSATTGHSMTALFSRTTSGDMADTYGGAIQLQLGDTSQAAQGVCAIDWARSGADNSGKLFLYTKNAGSWNASLVIEPAGNVTISGALSKASGSFRIKHPLESKKDTHNLVHSFIEGPKADLIYRGKVTLSSGTATVNIDTVSGMTEGTFVALCDDVQCFTTNESDWDAIKGSVTGNILTIESQNTECNSEISWMVIGDRKDDHMLDVKTDWTDENGKIILEPLQPEPVPEKPEE